SDLEIFQFGEALDAVQVGLALDQKQPFQLRPGFEKPKREFLSGLAKGQLRKPRHMGEAADVVDVIQSQVEALQVREVPEKIEISPKSPIHIEFYVGPIFDQAAGPLQLGLRQGLIELDHPTGGLERLE